MAAVTTEHVLALALALFVLGLLGILVRRDLIFVLMSLEIMLNSAVLAFAAAGARWHQADGQVWILFILVVAAAEVSVGLPLLLRLNRLTGTLDAAALNSQRAGLSPPPEEPT
ncbi:MAG: NADH-quinone oxidoreductase subunit NuoK [Myxococcota bacterium]|jgi:NADH-quinone oxidoreductase subunit K|nr:NADH-quinone oxidoreductase subunit NuoK [Myxococcota bacterium]